jgi:soluble lytic murein transglycosylase
MLRFARMLILIVVFAALVAVSGIIWSSPDRMYSLQRLAAFGRYSRYDALIEEAAKKNSVDPVLVRAVVWRESAFHPDKMGSAGERGLMQVGEAAAMDWARANKIETFVPTDLFEPRTNLEVGAWYLKRALEKWKTKDDPVPFALAEYNAGGSRIDRWIAATGDGAKADSRDLLNAIDFPSTRRYVEDIMARAKFYRYQSER